MHSLRKRDPSKIETMKTELKSAAAWALEILLHRSVNEREVLGERLAAKDSTIDRAELLTMVLDKLNTEYMACPQKEGDVAADSRATSRFWLLTVLGYIGNADAIAYLRAQLALPPAQDHYKARFWALESLMRLEKAEELVSLAQTIAEDEEEDSQVRWLAKAIIAQHEPDGELAHEILTLMNDIPPATDPNTPHVSKPYEPRKAMRYAPLPKAIDLFCNWVRSGRLDERVADAVQVLVRVPADHAMADTVRGAIIAFVRIARNHSSWDDMRAHALGGLRKLRAVEAETLLIDELSSPNLAILFEASKALEEIFGVPKATQRITEAASQNPQFPVFQFGNALRCMNRESVAEELEHLTRSEQVEIQEAARALLADIGGRAAMDKLRNRTETMRRYLETLQKTDDDMRKLFERTIEEARSGYTLSNMMNLAVFLVGLAFLGVFLVLIMRDSDMANDALSKIVTGAGGALAIVYNLLISKQMDRVNSSVERIMAMKVTFLGYLRQLEQADQAFNRRYMEVDQFTTAELREFETIVGEIMAAALQQIGRVKADTAAEAGTVVA
jgi:hypothetical protein